MVEPEEQRNEVTVLAPEEALYRARPLPPAGQLIDEDVTDEEWARFQEALAEV